MNNLLAALLVTVSVYFYVYPVPSTSAQYTEQSHSLREVVKVSQKKHIKAEHIKGLDTYDNPINYHVKEQFILMFEDRNGFFVVSRKVFNNTKVGDMFVTEKNELYYCRRSDGCYD